VGNPDVARGAHLSHEAQRRAAKFVAVGSKPESLALVFLWFGLTEKELRTKLLRRKMTKEAIEQHLKAARERLPV
jgi:hypothetical protein